jgi:uncharacterized protein with von Willebrand factor type A (vWA) domain
VKEPTASFDRVAVAFTRLVRERGLDVAAGAAEDLASALAVIGFETREHVYWAARLTLIHRPEDVADFDRCFAAFWHGVHVGHIEVGEPPAVVVGFDDAPADEDGRADEVGTPADATTEIAVRYSGTETLRERDFADYTAAEFAEARRLMSGMRLVGEPRLSRRRGPARHGELDLRRTVRAALRTGGEPVTRPRRARTRRPRRVVLLCDVSGSMDPYARALVRFLHTAVVGRGQVEAFAFGTRLTRITRELSHRDPDRALTEAAARVVDWSGGTRIGASLRTFNRDWGARGMARGAIVIILSDGWDRGEPELLAAEMERLHRMAQRVIWVNPLKATPGFTPTARGLAAALPYVDALVEGHSLAALDTLVASVAAAVR